MNIALMAHDTKKEMMIQLCIAYKNILGNHQLYATAKTGKLVADATGLEIVKFLSGEQGGDQQIAAKISWNEIDMVLYFRDPKAQSRNDNDPGENNIIRLCDINNIAIATNSATAEVLIHGLERGDLDWREIVKTM